MALFPTCRPFRFTIPTMVTMLLALVLDQTDLLLPASAMIASHRPSNDAPGSGFAKALRRSLPLALPMPELDLTSSLISQLAVIALKIRLADHQDVSCDVSSSSADLLLRGRVGPVTVKGRGWRSGLGLTCRALEATVDTCELDVARILSSRKLVLTTPAQGKAMIALDGTDFGNFITHPLLKPPGIPAFATGSHNSGMYEVRFLKAGSTVDSAQSSVTFYASCKQALWKVVLSRGSVENSRAALDVSKVDDEPEPATSIEGGELSHIKTQLRDTLTRFFNEMVFELDGTYLSFRDLMVSSKVESPCVMLALNIRVKKFPSPGVAF